MALAQFIFGGDTGVKSPQELARLRMLAESLAPSRSPKTVGEGLSAIGDALGYRLATGNAAKMEAAGQESAQSAIARALGGAGSFPAAPASGGTPVAAQAPNAPYAGDLKSGIQSTAEALGIDPIDLGTAISYETAGTFDPAKKGPTTQWGQHKGLIQFGEPQAQKYGVDWQNPVGSQLGPDGAVAKYLRDTGVKPGMGLLDIYSAINAGGVGKYGASDANNGGAPGTVRDKVEKQMAAHRAKALALLGGGQVASNDPSVGAPQALAAVPPPAPAQQAIAAALNGPPQQGPVPGTPAAVTPAGQRVVQQMVNPASITGGAPMPLMGAPQQAQAAPDQSGKPQGPGTPGEIRKGADGKNYQYAQTTGMAGASGGQGWIETNMAPQGGQGADNLPVMAGGSADAVPKGQLPSMQQLMEASQNPWLNDSQRAIVNMLMKQQMDAQDPSNQMGLEKQRLEIEALKNPKPKYDFMAGKDGSIFRANETEGSIDQVYGGKPDTFRTLTAEEKVKMGLPADGAYQIGADNKISQIGGGGTTVNIDQKTEGAFDKKLAENQATMLTDMATGGFNAKADLGVINELGGLLKNNGGAMTGISGWLAQRGIGGEGMSDLQAADALINKLIPSQRQAGSGSMSDRDVEMFRASLPSLWKSPAGNEKVLQVMQGLAQYKIQQGDIATKVMNGEMTRQEASKALGALPNPLAEFGKTTDGAPQAGTVEDGYRFKGGDPADPKNWEPAQ